MVEFIYVHERNLHLLHPPSRGEIKLPSEFLKRFASGAYRLAPKSTPH
jgi:hypothetical protein